MTDLQALNRKMLALEKQGHLTEQEYTAYKQLLEAVELLKEVGDVRDMGELMNLWDHKIEPVLEKLAAQRGGEILSLRRCAC